MFEFLCCPFCGEREISEGESLLKRGDKYYSQAGCTNCGAMGPVKPVSDRPFRHDESNNAWNIRLGRAKENNDE